MTVAAMQRTLLAARRFRVLDLFTLRNGAACRLSRTARFLQQPFQLNNPGVTTSQRLGQPHRRGLRPGHRQTQLADHAPKLRHKSLKLPDRHTGQPAAYLTDKTQLPNHPDRATMVAGFGIEEGLMTGKRRWQRLAVAGCFVVAGLAVKPSPAAANYNSYTLDGCPAQGSNWNQGGGWPWVGSTNDPWVCFGQIGMQFQNMAVAWGQGAVLRARTNPKPAWTKHYFNTSVGWISFTLSCGC